jgi:hypothetical protein
MRGQTATAERKVARIATTQHGVVTRSQLLEARISSRVIDGLLGKGVLLQQHRGVYRVGHRAPSVEASYIAAVLACGEGALLCGRAAAYVLGLIKGKAPPPEVLVPRRRSVEGIITRRTRRVEDAMTFRGVPVTTVARTLVDLAAVLPAKALARACHEAGVRYRTTPGEVEAVLARRPNSPGIATLRRVLRGDERVTLSRPEERFLELLRGAGLPLPETNRPAGGRRVDCRWPEHRLTVELDSYRFHNSRHAWEQDRKRERQAYARGDQFRRYSWEDVFERPAQTLRELREVILGRDPRDRAPRRRAASSP